MIIFLLFFVLTSLFVLIQIKRNKEIELQILSVLLRYGEMYGLQIADTIKQDFGRKPGCFTLYPALRRLERQGFVTYRWGEERPQERGGARRKYYRRTGRRILLQDRTSKTRSPFACNSYMITF